MFTDMTSVLDVSMGLTDVLSYRQNVWISLYQVYSQCVVFCFGHSAGLASSGLTFWSVRSA